MTRPTLEAVWAQRKKLSHESWCQHVLYRKACNCGIAEIHACLDYLAASLRQACETCVYAGAIRVDKWGNPFVIGEGMHPAISPWPMDRAEVIQRYRDWVLKRFSKDEIKASLAGKHLVCWCAPLPCHADVLMEIANSE